MMIDIGIILWGVIILGLIIALISHRAEFDSIIPQLSVLFMFSLFLAIDLGRL